LSADTDESMLEVSVGKSFLAAVTAAFAVLWTLETADVTDDAQALKKIAKLTPSFLAGTRGPRGTIWLDENGQIQETPAFPVHTVDTLGAGDVFHGAFALAITEKQELRQALRFASAAAALKCTRFGGAFAAPQRAEVEELLSHGQIADRAQTGQ